MCFLAGLFFLRRGEEQLDKQTTSTPIWRNKKTVPIILQAAFVIVVGFALYFMITNMLYGLEQLA